VVDSSRVRTVRKVELHVKTFFFFQEV